MMLRVRRGASCQLVPRPDRLLDPDGAGGKLNGVLVVPPGVRLEELQMTNHYPLDRRTFLVAGGLGFFGLNLANAAAYAPVGDARPRRRAAKSTIMIWLSGGASHIDTWD